MVVAQVDAERLREFAWPVREMISPSPSPGHYLHPHDRLTCPQQDCGTDFLRAAHHIGAPVNSVGSVNVKSPGRAEHRVVRNSLSPERVAGWIVLPVGFHLGKYHAGCFLSHIALQQPAEQFWCRRFDTLQQESGNEALSQKRAGIRRAQPAESP